MEQDAVDKLLQVVLDPPMNSGRSSGSNGAAVQSRRAVSWMSFGERLLDDRI